MLSNDLKRKIERLRAYLDELALYLESPDELILARDDQTKLRAVERIFQLVVDEAVDINTLIIAGHRVESPESYRSTFYALAEAHILDYHFAERISESARLRNNLIHEYEKLTLDEVLVGIRKQTPLFQEYLNILIKKFVGTEK